MSSTTVKAQIKKIAAQSVFRDSTAATSSVSAFDQMLQSDFHKTSDLSFLFPA